MSSASSLQLLSAHIIERNPSQDFLWAWSYPFLSNQNRLAYLRKFLKLLKESKNSNFHFFHHGDQWVYIYALDFISKEHPKVEFIAVVLCSLDFNPERYEKYSEILTKSYINSGKPQTVLKLFLEILTTGKCITDQLETFYFEEFDEVRLLKHPRLSEIIERFGVDTILIYTAILLKRRIIVYHHNISCLNEFVMSLPAFVAHRNIWNALYPFTENTEAELSAFKDSKYHILGSTDENIYSRTDLYDVYVNVPAAEVTVAPHAKESMTMTKTHKDIALFMVQLTEKKGFTERDIMQEITRKTKELIENLRILGKVGNGPLTLQLNQLREKDFSNTLEAFLLSLAQAENFVVID